jgi:hypothetical protein
MNGGVAAEPKVTLIHGILLGDVAHFRESFPLLYLLLSRHSIRLPK